MQSYQNQKKIVNFCYTHFEVKYFFCYLQFLNNILRNEVHAYRYHPHTKNFRQKLNKTKKITKSFKLAHMK